MKKTDPLSLFKKQIDNLAETLAPIANKKIAAPCFDTALFHHRSDSLGGYMQQIRDNFTQLITSVEAQRSQQVKFLATQILQQIEALTRELSTQTLRKQENQLSQRKKSVDLYQKLAQHQDYERRLQSMIQDRELALTQAQGFVRQQELQKEIAALENRLARCKSALVSIEKSIERQEDKY
ncbi:primosomal replication protein PriC [Proteus mirabilis]|uniref:primosomal replication protein PriC n=1 Tax=Proteus mirabilis TaxID=584 RepID=UPI0007AB9568|nr:primosomal replication protein [Proteus mirabilis]EKY1724684.1 primosomal replication protein [Proteus mirabilis]KZE59515.1 prepilin peptidase [Proteus mirabilis]MBG2970690.1 primosomal replication protein [Proteus mirabilis]MDE8640068.1 primosomal replication protein [Proteus mirabilis]MDE8640262.1 primosomal replication protein [Proteus mirabilis]